MYMLQVWTSYSKLKFVPGVTSTYHTQKEYESHCLPQLDRRMNSDESADEKWRTNFKVYKLNENNGNWDLHLEVGPVE